MGDTSSQWHERENEGGYHKFVRLKSPQEVDSASKINLFKPESAICGLEGGLI